MNTKNIFLIMLFFCNNILSYSLKDCFQEAKNWVKKHVKNVPEKQFSESHRYLNLQNVMQLFRMYCVVAWLCQFLFSINGINFLLSSKKTEKLALFLVKNQCTLFSEFNNDFLIPMLNPGLSFFSVDNGALILIGSAGFDIFWKWVIFFRNNSKANGLIYALLGEIAFLLNLIYPQRNLKDLSSLNLTHLSFNKLEPIIPLLLKNDYFIKKYNY